MRRLVVLGASGGYPTPGQPCSGYLLEWDDLRIVIDLGYGTLPTLLARVSVNDVDAVVVTHEHPDHCVDLHGLFRARLYDSDHDAKLPLYCPPGVLDRLAGLEPDVDLAAVFDHHALPGTYEIGSFKLVSLSLPHFVPNVGLRLSGDQIVVAYATDTGPHEALTRLGRGADVFVLDATEFPGEVARAERNLLTAEEAGWWAQRAGARRLVLTHLWPGIDPVASIASARKSFEGPVLIAEHGLVLDLDN